MSHAKSIKATHSAIRAYHAALREFAAYRADHEGATETAFGRLLTDTARVVGWTLIPKQSMKVDGKNIIPDGTLRDLFLVRGHWEAKDTDDDLTVCASATRHRLNPWSYLRDVLDQLAASSASDDVGDLLPDAWASRYAQTY